MATAVTAPPAATTTTRETGHLDRGGKAFNRLAATCVTLFALIWLVPLAWALITSLRRNEDIASNPVNFFGSDWNFDAYKFAWETNPLGYWYVNSFIISTLAVIFAVVICSMVALSLVNLHFRGKRAVFAIILAGLMLPMEALVLPQFMEFRALNLLGTYWAVIFPSVALPVAVFVFHSFIKAIPSALIAAARLDGRSEEHTSELQSRQYL